MAHHVQHGGLHLRRFWRVACKITFEGRQVQARRTEFFSDGIICAHGASDQATRKLALKVIFRREPTLKAVLLAAMEVKNFHALNLRQKHRP
jgi:hypothetical protein